MATDAYRLRSELLGPLPVINHFLARMGLAGSLQRFVPHDDARLRLAPAVVLGVVVRNPGHPPRARLRDGRVGRPL